MAPITTMAFTLLSVGTPAIAFAPMATKISSPSYTSLKMSSIETGYGQPTELPDSLDDSALIAARACSELSANSGLTTRCRVDFDTSIGDETYTTLKSSTEFMQKFVTGLCYEMIPGLKEMRQQEMMALVQAKAEFGQILAEEQAARDAADTDSTAETADATNDDEEDEIDVESGNPRKKELLQIIQNGGRQTNADGTLATWDGPVARIYFPDEGSAALARRDWKPDSPSADEALVPPCVQFSSCGGVQSMVDNSKDVLVFFFCPKASEAEFVEETLMKCEEQLVDQLQLTVFVNPLLVDMGVTGFGMAGRMLRERLIDPLTPAYYLRTLSWGALTRVWPSQFTVWQEDGNAEGGYRMIKSMDRLPSNPEVEDIYDYENGLSNDPEASKGFGLLNAIGDFVNGMTRL